MMRLLASLTCAAALFAFIGCSNEPSGSGNSHTHDDGTTHTHADGTTHSHDEDDHAPDAHGPGIELGSATIGAWEVRASRDVGEINAGGDAPIDVWLNGDLSKVAAVRFWIGTEDAKGSVKARAEIEDPAEANRWHTHAEIPDPMPADARLWVEIEAADGSLSTGSFDLTAG